jgi:hypothetical protein
MPRLFGRLSFEPPTGANTESTIPTFVLAAATNVPQITIEDADGRTHFLSPLMVTGLELVKPGQVS